MSDLESIHERNRRVEADKAWETSWTRRLIIAAFTYIIAYFYMNGIGVAQPWLHAAVPCGGYLLSTISLPVLKSLWLRHFYKV